MLPLTKYYVDKCALGWIPTFNVESLVRGIIDMVTVVRITIFVVAVYISINSRKHIHIQGVPGGMDKTSGECSLC